MTVPAIANLVHETTTGTGTGNLTLTPYSQSFNQAFGNGATTDVFYYFIQHRTAAEWEYGTGHMSAATTLVRDTVVESSNSNAAVNFSAGTKDVCNDLPARAVIQVQSTDTGLSRTAAKTVAVGDGTQGDSSGKASLATVTSPNTELVMEQTGDTIGTTRLRLQNRAGSNGAIFENASADAIDFGFLPSSGHLAKIRFEHQDAFVNTPNNSSNAGNASGEFQYSLDATGTPIVPLVLGANAFAISVANLPIVEYNITYSVTLVTRGSRYFFADISGNPLLDYGITYGTPGWTFNATTPPILQPTTIAGLPSPVQGMIAAVTDGDPGLAWGATAVNSGAGATYYVVTYNGTNWTVMGM